MDHQLSFADSEFNNKRRQTHKEKSLGRMEKLIPWWRLESVIEPHYPNVGNGRKPYPLSATVCSLSDPAIEDALYEIASMRLFAGFSLDGAIPDHTTIMNFRHLLERYDLACKIFDEISEWLSD